MKHLGALILKYLMIAIILSILLSWLTALDLGEILVISAAVTLVAYLLGDLLVLSRSNNLLATVTDAVLALIVILLFNYASGYEEIAFTDALICSVVIGIGEWFFHKFVSEKVFPQKDY